jgi:hypothetical protein
MKRLTIWSFIFLFGLFLIVNCVGGDPQNAAPVADAGDDYIALYNNLVVLDGSGCRDTEGDALTYSWAFASVPSGSTATLSNDSAVAPMFTADKLGIFIVDLVVNDGNSNSQVDSVSVKVISSVSSIPDTGQSKTYDNTQEIAFPYEGQAFYGQDAQYTTNPMIYSANGNTVTDHVTGLMWQKEDDGTTYNWYEASGTYDTVYNPDSTSYCDSLSLGGYADWRLPDRRELVSLFSLKNDYPYIDTLYFPQTGGYLYGDGIYWTYDNVTLGWGVNFGIGIISSGYGKDNGGFVRCVRGAPWGVNDFVDNGNGTVTDNMSGLVWQQADDGVARKWEDALAYCENLSLAESTDWRTPDIKELESIVDITAFNPSINATFFSTTSSDIYWSSSTTLAPADYTAFGADFYSGYIGANYIKSTSYEHVRCVR